MEIKNISGKVLLSVPVTDSAVIIEELMKQYSITLNWDAIENVELPLGAYIEHKNIKYSLLAPYQPQQRDEVTFEYKPEFQHPVMRWQYLPFLFYTYSNDTVVSKEPDWSLTDNAANFMAVLCDVIKEQTGEDWTYEVADNLPASASLSFSNKDIFSALNDIANAFETEWWFDYTNKVLYLSKASHGTEVALEVGNNISVPSVTQSKEGYYTRFLVFGSTRNIEQEYKGANTNSIVNKRLTLNPTKYPDGYIDIRNGLTNEEILTKTLVFDDIYPRSELTISDVKVALKWRLDDNDEKIKIGTDAEGNPVYDQYAVWYFKIPNFKYNEDLVIPNKPLSVHFSDGPLQGREFELWHEDEEREDTSTDGTAIRVEKGDYRIKYIEEGSYIIPSITGLVPVDGNKVTLFNILMPEEYKTSAYEELENAAQEEIAKQSEDMSNYSFSSNPVEFFTSNPNLTVGQKVTYKNGNYSYSTRVIKLETQLDRPYEQKITIGNEQIKGNTQTLKEEVVNANQNIDLISAINESTQQLVQSYQRTQKALQESMAKWGNMWRLDAENNAVYTPLNMIVEGTLSMGDLGQGGSETPVAGLQKVSITIPNYDSPFVSDAAGNVTLPAYPTALKNPYALKINGVTYDGSKEISINIEGGGGIADSVAWENVMGRPTKLSEFENDVPYATQKWVTDKGYLTSHQDISHLLSKQDAVTTYATITSLNAISDSLGNLRTEFDALNTLLNDDTSGVIDTWNEVVAFLNGYADSQDLATILSGMNTEIGKRAYQTDLDAAVSRIQTIENAYVDKASDQTITGVKTFQNGLKIGDIKLEWDSTNQALKIIGNAYVTELFSMGKISESGSGGGTASAAVRIMLGETPYDAVNGVVNLPAYPSLAGYATESWVTNRGYITASSIPTSLPASDVYAWAKKETLSGAINTLEIGTSDPTLGDYYIAQSAGGGDANTNYYRRSVRALLNTIQNSISLNWAKITSGKPTTLSGYGITDALSVNGGTMNSGVGIRWAEQGGKSTYIGQYSSDGSLLISIEGTNTSNGLVLGGTSGNLLWKGNRVWNAGNFNPANYLPNSGGILSDYWSGGTQIRRKDHNNGYVNLAFSNSDGAIMGGLGFGGVDNPIFITAAGDAYISLIHSGNIGSQSVSYANNAGNASTLNGYDQYGFYRSAKQGIPSGDLALLVAGSYYAGGFAGDINPLPITYASLSVFGQSYYSSHLCVEHNASRAWLRGVYNTSNGVSATDWHEIAFKDGNIASATKLQTARSIWGQSFDGTGDVKGNFSMQDILLIYKGNGLFVFGNAGHDTYLRGNNIRLQYGASANTGLLLNSSGNVLIGTTADNGAKLQVNGGISLSNTGNKLCGLMPNNAITSEGTATDIWLYNTTKVNLYGSLINLANNTTIAGNLTVSGGATFGGDVYSEGTMAMAKLASSSDRKLKENIKWLSADKSMEVVRALRPTEWNWKKDNTHSFGFIAQDVQPIIPEMVSSINDTLRLEYNQLHAFEVGAIQHIDSEVEILKRRVTELENELNEYRRNAQWQ